MNRICVIGGANLDVLAKSYKPIIPMDSNPGKVSFSIGGVGHNIACNLARLGCETEFITALSDDAFGQMIEQHCRESGLRIDHCQHVEGCSSSMYLAIAESDGNMNVAVADMDILSRLSIDRLKPYRDSLDESDIAVLDTNLTAEQLRELTECCHCRIFLDPISVSKSEKALGILQYLDFFKPNILEAEHLTGLSCKDNERGMLEYFVSRGVRETAISQGSEGVIATNGREYLKLRALPAQVVNATGAGDSFMAGFIYGSVRNMDFRDCLALAVAASTITIESLETVSEKMSDKLLMQYFDKVKTADAISILK